MLRVGGQYENRNGKYRVLSLLGDSATIEYENGSRSNCSAEILERIHRSLAHDKDKLNIERVKWSTLVRFKQLLSERGCLIAIHVHPDRLHKLQKEYLAATGQELPASARNLHVKPYYFRNSVAIQLQLTTHRFSSSDLPTDFSWTESSGNWTATCTTFGWELLRDGFRLGSNEPASNSVK